MGTSVKRENRRMQLWMTLSVSFAALFMASVISQNVALSRLEAWRSQLDQDLASLSRQKAELKAEIALRGTDAWLSQAAIEAGYPPPNGYALVTVDVDSAPAKAAAPPLASGEQPASAPVVVQHAPAATPALVLWDNPNWRAWRRLFIGRP